jgi:hypothetical protein
LALKSGGTVVAWGDNSFGQSTVPRDLNGVVGIAAGAWHSLALKSDGTVVCWGDNGDGESVSPASLKDAISVAAGSEHSLALKSDGTVVAWGNDHAGQSTVPAGLGGVVAIAAGGAHSLALKSDGTVVGWGANYFGQVTIPPGLNGVIAIAAGGYYSYGGHSLALKSDGTVVAWGAGSPGKSSTWECGQATVPTDLRGVIALAAGGESSFAITARPILQTSVVSQTAELGSLVLLGVDATGAAPLVYEWAFNGTNGISEVTTNSVLRLTSVDFSQAGTYSVVITNAFGAVTSAPAILSVIPPVEHRWVPGLILTGQTGTALNLDIADALAQAPNWAAFDRLILTTAAQWYFDLSLPLPSQRFYRAWQTGIPSLVPRLDIHLVPAITLAGNVGDKLRLDYINQFGPIDAWVTLATVALTNTSQLYFDVSAPGQPARLYRLVAVP